MRKFPAKYKDDFAVFKKLTTPAKVQDFLNKIPINFEPEGETCRSPLLSLKHKKAHCLEGAYLAAAALWFHGREPLLLDLRTVSRDDDHVVALFKESGRWGAISKTNHAVLRYREPVYASIRELAMSYFHEYFLDDGKKTMRDYSALFGLLKYGDGWLTSKDNLWDIGADLDDSRHFKIFPKNSRVRLRRADKVEIEAGKIVEWKKK
ncbi:MAG: hypothetical protein LiPW15_519 [Parcubacteria group bacterium LiPW_15]|nr:MAG: hypothetical protein LiPW15_519 [Parcubacteria group bacterium LiPW_15]